MKIYSIPLTALLLTLLFFAMQIMWPTKHEVRELQNIHGISFPSDGSAYIIEEELAHMHIALNAPIFAKMLNISVTFDPGNAEYIELGVREEEFWLAYDKHTIFDGTTSGIQTARLAIPLTHTLQHENGFLSFMLFAKGENISWKMYDVETSISTYMPSYPETRSYLRKLIYRHRPL